MATATISAVGVEVTTDLATHPQIGNSVKAISAEGQADSVSATVLALADNVYHRINPYFIRPSRRTDKVKIGFDCEHRPADSVKYAQNGTPSSVKWAGTTVVDSTRTRRKRKEVEASLHRSITATQVPPAKVTRAIVCEFSAKEYFNSRTMEWVKLPGTTDDPPGCHLEFDLHP